jgi:hypothetical protein
VPALAAASFCGVGHGWVGGESVGEWIWEEGRIWVSERAATPGRRNLVSSPPPADS